MRFSLRSRIALAVVRRQLPQLMAGDSLAGLPDGLHVAIVGSGSPLPDPRRGSPCAVVLAGERMFIVDAGEGSSVTMNRMQLDAGRIEAMLLTHFHSDHIGGISSVNLQRWIAEGVDTPMRILGPPGVERVVNGLNEAYALDGSYRTAHHGEQVATPGIRAMVAEPFEVPTEDEPLVLIDDDGLKVTAFVVDHSPVAPVVGFRFDYAGRSIVISGDTVYSPSLVNASRGVDLLVHDALGPSMLKLVEDAAGDAGLKARQKVMADIRDYHATPQDAARAATEAGAGALALTHIVPPLPLKALEEPFLGDTRDRFDGPLWLAEDGDLYSLPRGGSGVKRSNLIPRRR
jgi:ribonuclease Z